MLPRIIIISSLLLSVTAWAEVSGEPGACNPPCRDGYMCMENKCVSICNPPCRRGEQCVEGGCELMPRVDEPGRKRGYFALLSVFHAAIQKARNLGEIRLEIGGRYIGFQIGPAFGSDRTLVRSAIQGYFNFQPWDAYPFYLVPTVGLGYSFSWLTDGIHQQNIFIFPGLRLRYDVSRRLALYLELAQLEISFLHLESEPKQDVHRVAIVPISWNFAFGLGFMY